MTELRIRQSQLHRFTECQYSAMMALHQGDYPMQSHPQARGTFAHLWVEEVVRLCMERETDRITPDEGVRLMSHLLSTRVDLPLSYEEGEFLLEMAWFVSEQRTFPATDVVDLEETYSHTIDTDEGPVLLTGKPDVVAIRDTDALIDDYKSTWAPDPEAGDNPYEETPERAKPKTGTFQMKQYAWHVCLRWPHVERVKARTVYVRLGYEREVTLSRAYILTEIDAMLRLHATRYARSMRETDWTATPGSACAICPAANTCPIPPVLRAEEGGIATLAQAEEIATALVPATEAASRHKKALRAWCKDNGPVVVGDMEWGFTTTNDGGTRFGCRSVSEPVTA